VNIWQSVDASGDRCEDAGELERKSDSGMIKYSHSSVDRHTKCSMHYTDEIMALW
jgi:hypothetical protein